MEGSSQNSPQHDEQNLGVPRELAFIAPFFEALGKTLMCSCDSIRSGPVLRTYTHVSLEIKKMEKRGDFPLCDTPNDHQVITGASVVGLNYINLIPFGCWREKVMCTGVPNCA